jgi:hypothetical protein
MKHSPLVLRPQTDLLYQLRMKDECCFGGTDNFTRENRSARRKTYLSVAFSTPNSTRATLQVRPGLYVKVAATTTRPSG